MAKDIAIYGAGGLGREVALLIDQINAVTDAWNILGFYDDNKIGAMINRLPVLGGLTELNQVAAPISIAIGIADGGVRQKIVSGIRNKHVDFPLLIHPSANIGRSNTFGHGCIICAGTFFTVDIALEEFAIVNLGSTIGHDVHIGPYSSIMPGCNISGAVSIGKNVLIGTGSQILQGLSIGSNSIVGAGAVVTRQVEEGKIVVGVPAKELNRRA